MKPSGENIRTKVLMMYDEEGNIIESCPHPGQKITIQTEHPLQPFDILRKEV
jgi:putative protease